MIDGIWNDNTDWMITSFWGWSPESWGTVSFTNEARRDNLIEELTDPFITVIYVTLNAPNADDDLRGKIVGFYVTSHISGDRDEFTGPQHYDREVGKWRYGLKATRAFSFLPEYRPLASKVITDLNDRARAIAQWGEALSPDAIALLKSIPFIEVPVYNGAPIVSDNIYLSKPMQGRVRGGPANRSGYTVLGEPDSTEKELYGLILDGDTNAYLGVPSTDLKIYKIGLSMSPKARLEAFRRSMPNGAFCWELCKSTRADGDAPYPSFETAIAGEEAMKDFLADNAEWLGGEFYAATPDTFERAWELGKEAATAKAGELK